MQEIVNGILYILSTGYQRRAIPKDLPPRNTVYEYLNRWEWGGTIDRIHDELYERCREQAGREASPTAAIIDSQSVKSAEKDSMRRAARQHFGGCRHALLDVNVANEKVFPVAYVLEERGIPFLFVTGYGQAALPRDRPDWEACSKPIQPEQLAGHLARKVGAG